MKPKPYAIARHRLAKLAKKARARKQPQNISELVLRTLVDIMPDRIYAKDTQSRFIFANKAVATLMGATTPEDMLGKTDFDFYPKDIATPFFAVEQDLLQRGVPVVALEQFTPDESVGQGVWLHTTKVHLRDDAGKLIGLVGIGRNISERKRIEEELRTRNQELSELNERLTQTQEQLLHSEKLASLGRVVAGVAHELNTPLGNAITVVTTLDDQYREFERLVRDGKVRRADLLALLETTREGQTLLQRNIVRAANLVSDFKQLAVDQASESRRKFDLATVIRELLVVVQPQFKHTPFTLQTHLEPGIVMDGYPGPLGQAIGNLALNALIHAFDGKASGCVRISCARPNDTQALILCADDGIGMPPEIRRRMFEPFFTTKFGKGGSGLGLHIVHTIVVGLLGGKIDVSSDADVGTEFKITLPLNAPAHIPAPAEVTD